jgi:hypothetical protein
VTYLRFATIAAAAAAAAATAESTATASTSPLPGNGSLKPTDLILELTKHGVLRILVKQRGRTRQKAV